MNLVEQARQLRKQWQRLLTANDDTTIIDCEDLVDSWQADTDYVVDDIRKFDGQVYRCIQAHTSQPNWIPSNAASLWTVKHTKNKDNSKPFVQPQGAHDAYMKDEVVSFEIDGVMKLCISKVDNNAYSPADYPQNWTIE